MSDDILFRPIGVIRTEHTCPSTAPIQPCYAPDSPGRVELFPEFAEGLNDLEGYSHLYLIYHHHRAEKKGLMVKPCLLNEKRGVFSTRIPGRPNPIGLSIVRLIAREGAVLHIAGADMLDGTPLLDIKPYSRRIDCVTGTRDGWQDDIDDAQAMYHGRRGGLR
jgi:tRNA-Thr(GGU) m(6)t(6)A37 methyltransferase TsaA